MFVSGQCRRAEMDGSGERRSGIGHAVRDVAGGDVAPRVLDVVARVVEEQVGAERLQERTLVASAEEEGFVQPHAPVAQREDHALVRGRRARVIGRISMDMTVVDVTGISEVMIGDVATLIGSDGEEEISVDDVAAQVGTISYEILTGLTSRLPRLDT